MKYKVFFAFQMDIDDKFGKGFIQSAIEIAIQKFKEEGIEITLNFGFRGTPGTPLLIEEMLKKSSESDMVIVDLTFTSSKAWSEAEKVKLFGKELKIKGKDLLLLDYRNEKKSPNPNVLLETGYAWAKKGTYRTLVVMNEAYGRPSELPVDFDGFRWGITFNLSDLNYVDRKNKRKELADEFYRAIKASINSEMSYQADRWRPFDIFQEWNKKHPYPFKLVLSLKTKLLECRDKIIHYKEPLRIVGKKDCGKTRFVLELLKSNDEIPEHELLNSILYFDLINTNYSAILNQIHDLKRLDQVKIVVIDNCDDRTHETLSNIFNLTEIRLITINTIENEFQFSTNSVVLDDQIAIEVNKEIINERFNSKDIAFVTEKIGISTKKLITILNKDITNYNNTESFIKQYLSQISLSQNELDEYLNFMATICVFGIVGITGNFKDEIEEIRNNILGESYSEEKINDMISNLIKNEVFINKGDFILVNVFNEDLIQHWWKQNKNDIEELFNKISKLKLYDKFTDNLMSIIDKLENKWIISLLLNSDILLNNDDFVKSKAGEMLLYKLSEKLPNEVLKVMSKKINKL